MNKYMNTLKKEIGIKKANPLLIPFSSKVIKNTQITTNDNTFILAGKGSGKTTLLTLLMKDYERKKIFTQYIYCYKLMEETFAEEMKNFKGNLLYVDSSDVVEFLRKFTRRKQKYLSIIKWLKNKTNDEYEEVLLNELKTFKPKQKKLTFKDYAVRELEKYGNDFIIKLSKNYECIGFDGFSKTMIIYDDILNFPELFSKRLTASNEFFANFFNFTRHYLIDNYTLGHRHTNLSPDLRQSITNWFIGINVPQKDLKSVYEQLSTVFNSYKDFYELYEQIDKFDFLFVNSQSKYVEVIKHDSGNVSTQSNDADIKLKNMKQKIKYDGDDEDDEDDEETRITDDSDGEDIKVKIIRKTINKNKPTKKRKRIIVI